MFPVSPQWLRQASLAARSPELVTAIISVTEATATNEQKVQTFKYPVWVEIPGPPSSGMPLTAQKFSAFAAAYGATAAADSHGGDARRAQLVAASLGRLTGAVQAVPLVRGNRNQPCPCGSGKKFKRCCIGKPAKPEKKENGED